MTNLNPHSNVMLFNQLTEVAKQNGYEHRFFVAIINNKLMYNSYYPVIFNVAWLKAIFKDRWRDIAHETLEHILMGGNPIKYQWMAYKELKQEAINQRSQPPKPEEKPLMVLHEKPTRRTNGTKKRSS